LEPWYVIINNIGLKLSNKINDKIFKSENKYILFIDGDVLIPKNNLLEVFLKVSLHTNADCLTDFKDLIEHDRVAPYPNQNEKYIREIFIGNSIETGIQQFHIRNVCKYFWIR
jgi:hypothetical protein